MKSLFRVVAVLVAVCLLAPLAHGEGACCLFGDECVDVPDVGACNGLGGVYLEGETCASDACGLGACCDGDNCVGNFPAFPCITSGRTFAGAGTTCLQDPCGSGVGECCLGGGACADTSPEDCATMGGQWLGAGTACADGLCDLGACCLPGECVEMLNLECDALGGVFTADVTCGDDPCANDVEDCPDDALYGQSRDQPTFASVYTSEASAGFIRWDKFTGVPGAIETLTFWGLDLVFIPPDFVECSEPDPTFEITFYADAGGAPGPAVCSYTLTVPPVLTGVDYFGLNMLRYDVTLPDSCALVNGWLSIVGLGDEDCWFLWLSAREGDGFSLCHGCIAEVEGDDLAFCLGGTAGGVFGACCDDTSGTCVENIEMSDCTGPDQRFAPDGTCDDLAPDCGIMEGACCFEIDATCVIALEEICGGMGGLWLGPFTLCDQCPCSVPCPEGATLEGEPVCEDGYVDVFNGGCGPDEAYSPISAGETICGTNGVFTGIGGETFPDSDWYQYNVNEACELRFTVEAEFRPIVAILEAPCPGTIIAGVIAFECEAVTVAANVAEGTYWLVVQAGSNTDSAACPAEYVATLEVIFPLPCPGDTNGDGDVDVNDLNNVILDWGTDGSANGGDVTGAVPGSPPDGIVNVNDLNAVIVGWGRCP